MSFTTKDSGQREQHDTGAQRDSREGKGRYDLISPIALARLAELMERGATKYEARNWEKGFKLCRCYDSAIRHAYQWLAGDRDEDHLAGALFNLAAIMHGEAMIERGRWAPELDDRPDYTDDGLDYLARVALGTLDRADLDAIEAVPDAMLHTFVELAYIETDPARHTVELTPAGRRAAIALPVEPPSADTATEQAA